MKAIKIKTVITSTQSVWVMRPTRNHLGAISACLGPVCLTVTPIRITFVTIEKIVKKLVL